MLDDYGVIEYDAEASKVSTTARTRAVAQTMWTIVDVVEGAESGIVQSSDLDR
jgi:hypothetical protein